MYLNNHYNKNLKEFARELRTQTVSKAEKRIWKIILSREQTGVRFLRQRPIDRFIVDFFAPTLKLIIEIDGSSHFNKPEYDYYRQKRLESLGYKLIRFTEGEVLNQIEKVDLDIRNTIFVSLLEKG